MGLCTPCLCGLEFRPEGTARLQDKWERTRVNTGGETESRCLGGGVDAATLWPGEPAG